MVEVERFKNAIIYDVELFRNLLLIGFYSYRTNKYLTLSVFPNLAIDERDRIFKLVEKRLLGGYNNKGYDDFVLNYMFKHRDFDVEQLWRFSQRVLKNNHDISLKDYKYTKHYESFDLKELTRLGKQFPSLKHIGCMLKHDKLQDLPVEYDKPVSAEQFTLIEKYNKNDLDITIKLCEQQTEQLIIREELSKTYGIDLYCVANPTITEELFKKYYTEKTGDDDYKSMRTHRDVINISDLIFDFVKFETDELTEFLNWLKTQTLTPSISKDGVKTYDFKHKLLVGDLKVKFGLGGIHSDDLPLSLIEDDEHYILDLDVTSQYPSIIINQNVFPAHLDSEVAKSYLIERLESRVKYKRLGKQTGQSIYKIRDTGEKVQINGFYGKYKSQYSVLYDPVATFKVTVNNQLLMLMLIERLQTKSYNVISTNTDGITLHIPKDKLEHVRQIYKQWEKDTGFNLEETYYERYHRLAINDYVTKSYNIDDKGERYGHSTKYKGVFLLHEKKELKAGYEYPIIAIALNEYFLNGKSVKDTIYNHRDIYDFCKSEKSDKKFTNYLQTCEIKYKLYGKNGKAYVTPHSVEKVLDEVKIQSSVRFFVAKPLKILINHCNDNCAKNIYIGHKLRKRKILDGKRYQIVEVEPRIISEGKQHKREYLVRDLVNEVNLTDEYYTTKKAVESACKELNENNDGETIQKVQDNDFTSGYFINIFNDYYPVKDFKDYRINYRFYIDEVMKVVKKIECVDKS